MKLSEWAKKNDIAYNTALRWFKNGKLPVYAHQTETGTILVNEEVKANMKDDTSSMFLKIYNSLTNELIYIVNNDNDVKAALINVATLMSQSKHSIMNNAAIEVQPILNKDELYKELSKSLEELIDESVVNYNPNSNEIRRGNSIFENKIINILQNISQYLPEDKNIQEQCIELENMFLSAPHDEEIKEVKTKKINNIEIPENPEDYRAIPLSKERLDELELEKARSLICQQTKNNLLEKLTQKLNTEVKERTKDFQSQTTIENTNGFMRKPLSIESESGHEFLDTLTRYYEEKEDVTIEDFVTKINELIKEKTKRDLLLRLDQYEMIFKYITKQETRCHHNNILALIIPILECPYDVKHTNLSDSI